MAKRCRSCCAPTALPSNICPTVTACGIREPGSLVTVSNSAVGTFTRTAAGSGYTMLPEVTISGGGGSGAMAKAVSGIGGTIASLALIHGGTGYTSPPTITLSGGGGSGATFTANLTSTSIAGVSLTNGGSGYTSAPGVSFTGGGGSGAFATTTIGAGAVTGINLVSGGSGYTSAPTIGFTGGAGSGATATATLERLTSVTCTTAEQVTSVAVTNGGSGYTSAPTVSFPVGGGTGATATTTLTVGGTAVNSVTVTNGGSGFLGAPTVGFTGGGGGIGTRATAVINFATGVLTSITIDGAGALGGGGYTSPPTVVITPGVGSGATAVANMIATANSVTVTGGGSGYTTAPTATSSGGGGSGASYRPLLTATTVNAVTVGASGSNYTGVPSVALNTPVGHTGSGATASARMQLNSIASITTGGSGYTIGDLLTVSGGTSTTPAILVVNNVSGGVITSMGINTAGDYSALPTNPAAVTGGTGSGATFSLRWNVLSITVTGGGSNYSTAPTVAFSGGGGSGATATAAATATSVGSVTVTAAGSGYSSAPTLAFAGGGGGSGAAATVVLNPFTVGSVTVTNGGSGYSSLPGVAFSGGGGSGATATATVLNRCCVGVNPGTYTVSAGPPAVAPNYWGGAANTTVAVNATATPSIGIAGIIPYPASGFFSLQATSCAPFPTLPVSCQTGPSFLDQVYPTTLFVNDGQGLVSLSLYDLTSGAIKYAGCATRTAAEVRTSAGGCAPPGSSGSVPVLFTLDRSFAPFGGWRLSVSVPMCGTSPNAYPTTGTCNASNATLVNDVGSGNFNGAAGSGITTCTMITLTAAVDMGTLATPPTPIQQVYGPGSVNMSVSP